MKLSNLISKFHQTFARVLLAFNLFDSLFPHHAAKLKQNHQVNLKNSEPTQSKNDAWRPNGRAVADPDVFSELA
jgi:hypothetical protein